ncbi:MAG: cell envelope integrity protein CreD [Azoarcus sp.]|jgi:inner membrane protein|nr:cell envelope integrity protein CreD [Azoarcus sp.]
MSNHEYESRKTPEQREYLRENALEAPTITGGIEKFVYGVRNSQTLKFFEVLILTLLLMIPLSLIQGKISEREYHQAEVIREISNTAASAQTIVGPVLAIRYRTKTSGKPASNADTFGRGVYPENIESHLAYFPARSQTVRGRVDVERRYRGIYQARLLRMDAGIEGVFEIGADALTIPNGEEFVDARAAVLFKVSDLRGLDSDPEVLIDGKLYRFHTPNDNSFEGVMNDEGRLEIDLGRWEPGKAHGIPFSFPLKLAGTGYVSFAPTAENNIIELTSNWKHPSFNGRFLPRKRTIGEKGFSAQWEVSQLARNLKSTLGGTETLGVSFIEPVNIYLQAERAVKYGVLFIALTFAAFFICEILRRRPMHFMQYLLVGLSLAIFFLLLIALSEHLPFALAYLAGAAGCIGLIVFYLSGAFGAWRPALGFGGGIACLYGMLYTTLQLEDVTLLTGSLLLFASLAAAMFSTRHFDWYQRKAFVVRASASEEQP